MKQLLDLYRYLRGYLIISVSKGFPERFLNLCNKERLYLWDVIFRDNYITAKIYCKDFFRLKVIRRKSGVKIKILNKCGFIFFLKEKAERKVLLAGLTASLLVMFILNQFVWVIEINGTEKISKTEILESVNALGLDYGAFARNFDENKAGRDIVNHSDGRILWAAVNIKGSKAFVEIREAEEKQHKNQKNTSCNIVADFDGVILSNETYSGTSCVSSGNAVRVGDILISGISENSDGSVNFHSADGKLSALHSTIEENVFPCNISVMKYSDECRHKAVTIFGFDIPISAKDFASFSKELEYNRYLDITDYFLPFGVTQKIGASEKEESVKNEMLYIINCFSKSEYDRFKNTLVLSSEYEFSIESDCYNIKGEYECIDFIGKKIDILQEN